MKERTEEWSTVVKRNVDKELKEMSEKMKRVEETFELHTEEEKLRERKKNNIILHRLVEGERLEDDRGNMEEKKMVFMPPE